MQSCLCGLQHPHTHTSALLCGTLLGFFFFQPPLRFSCVYLITIYTNRPPVYLGRRMQRRLQAGAQCEDLRFYTPFFYRVGATQCALDLDEHMPALLLTTWRVRYRQLLVPSLRGDSRHDSVELMSKLTVEEQRLFEAGHGGVLAFERYRGGKQILQRYGVG